MKLDLFRLLRKGWLAVLMVLVIFSMLEAGYCVAAEPEPGTAAPPTRLLVMLHLPATHYRPDVSYSGDYKTDAGTGARRRIAVDLAAQYGLTLVSDCAMPALGIDCFVMDDAQRRPAQHLISMLSLDKHIEWVQTINTFRVLASAPASTAALTPPARDEKSLYPVQPASKFWHLAELHQITTGRNALIAVVDSGIEDKHPDLLGQVSIKESFVDDGPYRAELHGTQVAGVIAATLGKGNGIVGIAPEARLMALRACWQGPDTTLCNSFTLGRALNFAILNHANIINLSLAGPPDRLLQRLVQVALARGIVIVAAYDPNVTGGGFPSSYPGVLSVSDAPLKSMDARVLIAPGRGVPTTTIGGGWTFVSGSSFATAHITGMAALLLQLQPSMQPAQLYGELSHSRSAGVLAEGAGNINACETIQQVTGKCVCSCGMK